MAEYFASTSGGIKLSSAVKWKPSLPHNPLSGVVKRKFRYGVRSPVWSPRWKTRGLSSVQSLRAMPSRRSKRAMLNCNCLGSLVNPEGSTASSWIQVVDQVLLTSSIFLAYMAGVIPLKPSHRKDISAGKSVAGSSASSGSSVRNEEQVYPEYALDVVKRKLLDSLDAFEHGTTAGNKILGYNDRDPKRPLHLSALADGPRLRLLLATFEKIEEEVNNISNSESPETCDRLTVFSSVIQKSCEPVCMTWLEREHGLANRNIDMELVSLLRSKLTGDGSVLLNIKNSGKEDLYADLLCFLCFASIREGCYDKSLFISNGVSILEDFLINLADGMASMYLELISVDSNVLNEMNSLSLELCNLSTRALQRLRNEVALNQWLYQNMESVASMYEDRFDLCTLQRQLVEEPANIRSDSPWWKTLMSQSKYVTGSSSLCYVVISQFSMPVKRTKELSALTGWRYYFSLFLELSDIGMPLVRAVISKVSDGISFFLVSLIGRSLGLIYTGIRQSLRWK